MRKTLLFNRARNYLREYGFSSTLFAMREIFLRRTFKIWEKLGFYVIPKHYYYPIPETKDLLLRENKIWKNSELIGIDMNEKTQLRFLKEIFPKYKKEYVSFPKNKNQRESESEFYFGSGGIAEVDAEVLYCMIRHFKPPVIIEIGSGSSSLLIAQACRANEREDGKKSRYIIVDPYPRKTIKNKVQNAHIISKRVEELDFEFFSALESRSVLFIDSTHVVKIGGDVNYLYLEVLPRLKPGVIIHSHDIFLPYEYPKEWVLKEHRFWTEQYILQAFLTYNSTFEVLWGGHYMHLKYPDELRETFPSYNPETVMPGSFWIRRREES